MSRDKMTLTRFLRERLGIGIDFDLSSVAVSLGRGTPTEIVRVGPGKLNLSLPIPGPIRLEGFWWASIVTLKVSKDRVKDMLAPGLELAVVPWTNWPEPELHPLVLYFGEMFDARLNLDLTSFAENLKAPCSPRINYREHVVAIPYVNLKQNESHGSRGPFLFMPQLFLDHLPYTLGGWMLWGFNKRRAAFELKYPTEAEPNKERGYTIKSLRTGDVLIDLEWTPKGSKFEAASVAHFRRQRKTLDLPVISQQPLAAGPFFTCSDFKKAWSSEHLAAQFRDIHVSKLDICNRYVTGLDAGAYKEKVFEAFELRTGWSLSLPSLPRDQISSPESS